MQAAAGQAHLLQRAQPLLLCLVLVALVVAHEQGCAASGSQQAQQFAVLPLMHPVSVLLELHNSR